MEKSTEGKALKPANAHHPAGNRLSLSHPTRTIFSIPEQLKEAGLPKGRPAL